MPSECCAGAAVAGTSAWKMVLEPMVVDSSVTTKTSSFLLHTEETQFHLRQNLKRGGDCFQKENSTARENTQGSQPECNAIWKHQQASINPETQHTSSLLQKISFGKRKFRIKKLQCMCIFLVFDLRRHEALMDRVKEGPSGVAFYITH